MHLYKHIVQPDEPKCSSLISVPPILVWSPRTVCIAFSKKNQKEINVTSQVSFCRCCVCPGVPCGFAAKGISSA